MRTHRQQQRTTNRHGTATVELAITLPALMLISLGAIETANAIYLKQVVTSIAYEGARVASATGGTTADAETLCAQLLAARKMQGTTVTCTPITPATAPGTPITVVVGAPVKNNSVGVTRYFRNAIMRGSATMPRL